MITKSLNAKMLISILKGLYDLNLVYLVDLSIFEQRYLNFYDFKGMDQ